MKYRRKITAFPVLLWMITIVWLREFPSVDSFTTAKDISGSGSITFLPVIMDLRIVPEIDDPGCRWPFNSGQMLQISYKWGDELQTPGLPWRVAFESGLYSWNLTATPVWYYYDSNSSNVINTYYDEEAGNRGITYLYCSGPTTLMWEIEGNLYWDAQDQYTILERRGIATHELGHGISIGHIPNDYSYIALMNKYIDLVIFNFIYDPQPPDVGLVNQIYP